MASSSTWPALGSVATSTTMAEGKSRVVRSTPSSAAATCQKCSICETVCPVMANNPDYGGPKRSGPDGQRYRLKNGIFYDDSLKYCLNCKRCEVACPSGVRIADLIQQARIEFSQKSPKLRDVMLASTDQMGPLASAVAPIVNFSLGLAPVKGLLDLTIGLDHRRTLPKYSSETFVHWFNKNAASKQDSYKKHISYFHGCYANYNYPQLAKDFVAVMNAFGYGVHLIEGERCCGVAKIANGMIPAATRDAKANMSAFSKSLVKGRDIITVSTTCTMTLLEEYPELLKVDNSGILPVPSGKRAGKRVRHTIAPATRKGWDLASSRPSC